MGSNSDVSFDFDDLGLFPNNFEMFANDFCVIC